VTPDETLAVVGNRLPSGDASLPSASAAVSLVDLPAAARVTHQRLPANSMNVLGIAVSPDGRWAYAVHNLGRTNMSTERVTNGWISRNALTRLDLKDPCRLVTIPLDKVGEGAANPWGAVLAPNGAELWVSLSGVHQVGRLDLPALEEALRIQWPAREPDAGVASDASARGSGDSSGYVYGDATTHDLGVFTEGRFHRTDLPGSGPRGIALSPDGKLLAVAMYFSGQVLLLEARTARVAKTVALGGHPEKDGGGTKEREAKPSEANLARRGEEIFHDARRCVDHWLSCATCHPEGRADGLNWDLFNDGAGNPKNTRSLLLSHRTPPAMALGVRPDMESASRAGFESILFRNASEADLRAVEAYLRSLEPVSSPRRAGAAERGRAIFESPEAGCASCHPAPLFTDLALHDVGTRGVFPWEDRFDTPTLIELWRTAPYLHHGKAATLRDVFTRFNAGDRHGETSHLTAPELDALLEYLESL
jgi:mono/diheme cytochrome c family protein